MQQIRRFGDGNPPTSQFSAHIAARMLQNTRLRRSSTFCNAFHCQKTSIPSQTNNSKPRVPYTCRRKIESHPFWLAPRVVLALATFHHASHCQKTSIPPQATTPNHEFPTPVVGKLNRILLACSLRGACFAARFTMLLAAKSIRLEAET